jgi:hypothetical protein
MDRPVLKHFETALHETNRKERGDALLTSPLFLCKLPG